MKKKLNSSIVIAQILFCMFVIIFGIMELKIVAICSDNTVTIYLDESNQMMVRMAVMWYEYERKEAVGTEKEQDYPEITCNLVEKSYLSPEEQEKELYVELEAGNGPDIIIVDQDSTVDPYYLLESGWLLELDDFIEEDTWMKQLEFYPGLLEAGRKEEKQYLLPLSIQTPVLYAKEDALIESTYGKENIHTLTDLLQWAADYQKTTGMHVFAEHTFWDDIFLCSGLQMIDYEMNKADIPYEELRKFCDACKNVWESGLVSENRGSFLQPYEKIQSGEALFSATGLEDFWRTLSNVKVLESAENNIVFAPFPTQYGDVQTVISHSVGVNRNSKNQELAKIAARALLSRRVSWQGQSGQGMSAVSNQEGIPVTFFAEDSIGESRGIR